MRPPDDNMIISAGQKTPPPPSSSLDTHLPPCFHPRVQHGVSVLLKDTSAAARCDDTLNLKCRDLTPAVFVSWFFKRREDFCIKYQGGGNQLTNKEHARTVARASSPLGGTGVVSLSLSLLWGAYRGII